MSKFEVELEVTTQTKKRGLLSDYNKEKTYNRKILVKADDSEEASDLALDRIVVQTPGYKLSNVKVVNCKEKTDLENRTVTVTGKVWFEKVKSYTGDEYYKDITLDYVYAYDPEVIDEMLKDHAESRFRLEVSELDNFKYVQYIVCSIVSGELQQLIQI